MLIILLIQTLLIFLQSSVISYNLLLASVLALTAIEIDNQLLLFIFLSGILADILSVQKTGFTSLILLVITGLVMLYQRKFKTRNLLYLTISGILFFSLWAFLDKTLSLTKIGLETIITLALFGIYLVVRERR